MNATNSTPDPWSIKRLLAWMSEAFARQGVDSPRLSAEVLLSHVLRLERLRLYLNAEREATPDELKALRGLVSRALKHEPVQYLTGEAWFYGLPLSVDARVLIPRPCTEMLVEHAVRYAKARAPAGVGGVPGGGLAATEGGGSAAEGGEAEAPPDVPMIVGDELRARNRAAQSAAGAGMVLADVCTGSGAVAVALARQLPAARLVASDVSGEALEVARLNAARHAVDDRVEFIEGDLLAPVAAWCERHGARVDVLCANPPYIPDQEWASVERNVKEFEPTLALRGGGDGLEFVRPLIEGAAGVLAPGGLLLVEIASVTASEVERLAHESGLHGVRIVKDLEGLSRMLLATRG